MGSIPLGSTYFFMFIAIVGEIMTEYRILKISVEEAEDILDEEGLDWELPISDMIITVYRRKDQEDDGELNASDWEQIENEELQ